MADTDFAHTGLAQANRMGKAEGLARFMAAVRLLRPPAPGKERRDLERAAGVNRASDETWALAIELWREGQR